MADSSRADRSRTSCSHPRSRPAGAATVHACCLPGRARHRPDPSSPNAAPPNREGACVASAAVQMWATCTALASRVPYERSALGIRRGGGASCWLAVRVGGGALSSSSAGASVHFHPFPKMRNRAAGCPAFASGKKARPPSSALPCLRSHRPIGVHALMSSGARLSNASHAPISV